MLHWLAQFDAGVMVGLNAMRVAFTVVVAAGTGVRRALPLVHLCCSIRGVLRRQVEVDAVDALSIHVSRPPQMPRLREAVLLEDTS